MLMPADQPGIAKCGRIGRGMLRALEYVAAHPGCTKFACARYIGAPSGRDPAHAPASMYWTIDRCAELGFICAELQPKLKTQPRAVYALTITPSGATLLAERMTHADPNL
jgi:hypothetical protein